jgi:hypothetical protein
MLRPIKQVNKIKFLTKLQAANGHSLFAEKLNLDVISQSNKQGY